ncbi:DM13 domain-containing protein [Streptomyces roseolus]|uniref:DM13 domain-containing protein n=1 Tax=Streptomyces roseolus TaxID=67358 RepID=UPI0019A31AB4|nr:DM13 domain-containing protein [Streptomyces roseolus]GGR63863.1 hypothetical protein GCM10010282_66160 [Streptomyces roseolus]
MLPFPVTGWTGPATEPHGGLARGIRSVGSSSTRWAETCHVAGLQTPAGVAWAAYGSVSIWCDRFDVSSGAARPAGA